MNGAPGTPIGPGRCIGLLRGLTSPALEDRETWADVPSLWSDWGEFDADEELAITWVLAWAAVVEVHRFEVRERLLLSLSDLAAGGRVAAAALDLVTGTIERDDLHIAEVEMYDGLVAARSGPTRPHPSPYDRPNLPGVPPGEPVEPARCVELVRGLTDPDPDQRRAAARLVTAWSAAGRLDDDQARVLATVLTWAVRVEATAALVALLGALTALARRDLVPPWALDQLARHLAAADLDPTADGLRAELAAALAGHHSRAGTG
ncbi:MAG TPA: hypothetical protein VEZ42_08805 [Pseudonocardia sp.]|nr:hypothetical protein [Pseudonocardia sp.]